QTTLGAARGFPRHEFPRDVASRSAIAAKASFEVEGRLAAHRDIKGFAVVAFEIEPQTKALPGRKALAQRAPAVLGDTGWNARSRSGCQQARQPGNKVGLFCGTYLDMAKRVIHLPEAIRGSLGEILETHAAFNDFALRAYSFRDIAHYPKLALAIGHVEI